MQNTYKLRGAGATSSGQVDTKNDVFITMQRLRLPETIPEKATCTAGGINSALKERTKIYNFNILG
jgi:hypothetical protein